MYRRVPQDDFDDEAKYAKAKAGRQTAVSEAGPLDPREQGWGGVVYYGLLMLFAVGSAGLAIAILVVLVNHTNASAPPLPCNNTTAGQANVGQALAGIAAELAALKTSDAQAFVSIRAAVASQHEAVHRASVLVNELVARHDDDDDDSSSSSSSSDAGANVAVLGSCFVPGLSDTCGSCTEPTPKGSCDNVLGVWNASATCLQRFPETLGCCPILPAGPHECTRYMNATTLCTCTAIGGSGWTSGACSAPTLGYCAVVEENSIHERCFPDKTDCECTALGGVWDEDKFDACSPSALGPYTIGWRHGLMYDDNRHQDNTVRVPLTSPNPSRAIEYMLWYPAHVDAPTVESVAIYSPNSILHRDIGGFTKFYSIRQTPSRYGAYTNASFEPGSFPIVVLRDGDGSAWDRYAHLCEFVASHGFICIGFYHYSTLAEIPGALGQVLTGCTSPSATNRNDIATLLDVRYLVRNIHQVAPTACSPNTCGYGFFGASSTTRIAVMLAGSDTQFDGTTSSLCAYTLKDPLCTVSMNVFLSARATTNPANINSHAMHVFSLDSATGIQTSNNWIGRVTATPRPLIIDDYGMQHVQATVSCAFLRSKLLSAAVATNTSDGPSPDALMFLAQCKGRSVLHDINPTTIAGWGNVGFSASTFAELVAATPITPSNTIETSFALLALYTIGAFTRLLKTPADFAPFARYFTPATAAPLLPNAKIFSGSLPPFPAKTYDLNDRVISFVLDNTRYCITTSPRTAPFPVSSTWGSSLVFPLSTGSRFVRQTIAFSDGFPLSKTWPLGNATDIYIYNSGQVTFDITGVFVENAARCQWPERNLNHWHRNGQFTIAPLHRAGPIPTYFVQTSTELRVTWNATDFQVQLVLYPTGNFEFIYGTDVPTTASTSFHVATVGVGSGTGAATNHNTIDLSQQVGACYETGAIVEEFHNAFSPP